MHGVYQYDQDILRLRAEGLQRPAIAERLGICLVTITQCYKRYGIQQKRRPRNKPEYAHTKTYHVKHNTFAIRIIGEREIMNIQIGGKDAISVLPTSRDQFDRIMGILLDAGGEII